MNKETIHDIIKIIGMGAVSLLCTVSYVFAVNGMHLPRPTKPVLAYESYIMPVDQEILNRLTRK